MQSCLFDRIDPPHLLKGTKNTCKLHKNLVSTMRILNSDIAHLLLQYFEAGVEFYAYIGLKYTMNC